ncbi:hypothetical protein ACROYT_G033175 [Oculina patagonica]
MPRFHKWQPLIGYSFVYKGALLSFLCFHSQTVTFFGVKFSAENLKSPLMASFVKWGGRLLFFALLATQCGFLASYPAKYKDTIWFFMFAWYVPVVIIWICLMVLREADLRRWVYVWGLYIIGLLANIILIFGFVVDGIDKENFLGPNTLKMVLCITPVLLILLLNTADDSQESDKHRELVSKSSVQMAIDLLDVVEMLDIILEEKEHAVGISKSVGIAMVVVACFSLLLSIWQMAENKFNGGKPTVRKKTSLIRSAVEMVCVNLVFLIVRVFVYFKYGKDESIFIAKNGIAIILSTLEIRYLWDEANWQCPILCY